MPPLAVRRLLASAAALLLLQTASCGSPSEPARDARLVLPIESVLHLEVAPDRVPCVGEARMECLRVRTGPDAPWEYFYDAIEGFTHEPGYRYRLRVARRVVRDPPADGSSVAYRLLDVLEKVRG